MHASKLTLGLIIVTWLSGCGLKKEFSSPKSGQFVGYVSQERFFLLNTSDGTVFEYRQGKLTPVPLAYSKLAVGEIYEDEHGKRTVYEGTHRFSDGDKAVTDALLKKYGVTTPLPEGWNIVDERK